MSQVRVTETSLETIADAIRAKLGVQTTYRPSEMAAAIQSIPTGGSAVLEHLSVTQNGTYTPDAGVDGFDQVTVNVSGGGGGCEKIIGLIGTLMVDMDIADFLPFAYYGVIDKQGYKNSTTPAVTPTVITAAIAAEAAATFRARFPDVTSMEYNGYVYGAQIASDLSLVLLADASDGSQTTVSLNDSIQNYSAILLQGIYNTQKQSHYNTTKLYVRSQMQENVQYWAGMKDRNGTYDTFVTFTSNMQATLSGKKQVLIYGMP